MMTQVQHHPSADMLLSYSAGSAAPSHALCVATHLEWCSSCRAAHQRNNAIGGRLVERLNETNVDDSVKNAVFAKLGESRSQPQLPENEKTKPFESADYVPRALRSLVPEGFGKLKWQILSTTARSATLFKDDNGANVSLLKLLPGGQVARHTHMGDEYTIVLRGSFSDESGVYSEGDFLLKGKEDSHTPVATRDGECICLTVQEAPLQFTNGLFRLFNPLLRRQYQMT